MTQDDIIRMALESGGDWDDWKMTREFLVAFAKKVAAHERNECAKIVENYCGAWDDVGYALAQTIRARGKE